MSSLGGGGGIWLDLVRGGEGGVEGGTLAVVTKEWGDGPEAPRERGHLRGDSSEWGVGHRGGGGGG